MKRFFFVFGFLFLQKALVAGLPASGYYELTSGQLEELSAFIDEEQLNSLEDNRPNPLLLAFRKKHAKNKKAVAALLAFPFPFGIVGLHRIYLGCAPYVPVVYIGTAGGVLGILPFIDFCVLLLDNDIERYMNNKKIFMWVN